MSLDEDLLRDRLASASAQASPPRFAVADLVRRIRQRRTRAMSAVAGGAAIIAIAVALPLALSGGGGQTGYSTPAPMAPELSYNVIVNGQTKAFGPGLALPRYVITPGENLTITVRVSVQTHVVVTAVWLGITDGVLSPRPGGPAAMSPVLTAYTYEITGPAERDFRFRWTVPKELRAGDSRQLSVDWIWSGKPRFPGGSEEFIAELVTA